MKRRIKIVSHANGDVSYYPQHRFLGLWFPYIGFFGNWVKFKSEGEATAFMQNKTKKSKTTYINF